MLACLQQRCLKLEEAFMGLLIFAFCKCNLIFAFSIDYYLSMLFLTTTFAERWVTGRGYRYGMWRTLKVMCKRCSGYSDMK